MSAGVKSVPPWKLALIEKRRKQEQEDRVRRKSEEARITEMPTWKRDIILKKQQQKNSLVYFAKPISSNASRGDLEVSRRESSEGNTHELIGTEESVDIDTQVSEQVPSEEHIIPIQQNPWLRTDIKQRKYPLHRPNSDQFDNSINSYNSLPRNHGSPGWCEGGDVNDGTNEADHVDGQVFNDSQEVAYGRGFVHKLLKKFKDLSARDEKVAAVSVTSVGPKRSQSTENILEDSFSSDKSSPRHYSVRNDGSEVSRPTGIYASPVKARSMENLAGSSNKQQHLHPQLDTNIVIESRDSTQGSLDGSFSSGSIQSPRSTVGNDVANHYIICDERGTSIDDVPVPEPVTTDEPLPTLKRYGSSENLIEAELPRANIVSATRSLFENVSGTLTRNKTKRNAPSPKVEGLDLRPLPNGSLKEDECLESLAGFRMEGEYREGVSSIAGAESQLNGDDRNANYKPETGKLLNNGSRTGTTVATRSKSDQAASVNGSWSSSVAGVESPAKPRTLHSITHKNNQNNNRTSVMANISTSPEIISPDKGSSVKAEYNFINSSKKRHAPLPPSSKDCTTINDSDIYHKNSVSPKKPNLYLDLGSSDLKTAAASAAKQAPDDTMNYKVRYFAKGTPSPSISSSFVKNESEQPLDSQKVGEIQMNGILGTSSTDPQSPMSIKLQGKLGTTTSTGNNVGKVKAGTPPHSSPHSITSNRPTILPSSKPANGHAASLTLPIPKAGEVAMNTKKNSGKKGKRPVTSAGGPGSLLIRPASNLVPTSSNPNAQLPSIKKYKDVKTGVFQPPSANPTYLKGLEDEFDIPVTNIDDVMDDIPVTNIDDLGDSMTWPCLEQDADKERQILSKRYDFLGAGVTTSKNMLVKTRRQKLRITFNDTMTSTYEYPSEQSLLEELPPEPGDFDYIHQLHGRSNANAGLTNHSNDDDVGEELNLKAGAALQSTPGLGSAGGKGDATDGDKTGGLMSYRSRYMGDYQLGLETKESPSPPKPLQQQKESEVEENIQITPAEDDDTYNWSNAATSDLLF